MQRTLPIRTLLRLATALAVLAFLAISAFGLVGMRQSNLGLDEQSEAARALREGMKIDVAHDGLRADVYRLLYLATGSGRPGAAAAGLSDSSARLLAAMDGLVALELNASLTAKARAALPAARMYVAAAEAVAKAPRTGDQTRAALTAFGKAYTALELHIAILSEGIEAHARDATARAVGRNQSLTLALLAATVVACLVLVLANWKTSHHILQPVERLRAALRQVATGDFSVRIGPITRDDDVGAIARDIDIVTTRVAEALADQRQLKEEAQEAIDALGSGLRALAAGDLDHHISVPFSAAYDALRRDFNDAQLRLRGVIAEVIAASHGIHRLSTMMRHASDDLSLRTQTQAATLEQTAAALEELTNSVRAAAETAAHVEGAMDETRLGMEDSGRIVRGAVEAMDEIDRSAGQITQIIGVIDDIAFQTNLLALNAGVEAARAGEAGKGFAVVASEVRALAQRSSQAAREIKALIGNSADQIRRGVDQVNRTGAALEQVVARAAEMAQMVSSIAASAAEQARGLSEINFGVAQLDQVTQQNAVMAEDAGTTTRDMGLQADGLAQLVARFRTEAQDDRTPAPDRPAPDRPAPNRPATDRPAPPLRPFAA